MTHTDPGDHTPPARTSRRSLIGAGLGASILGAAVATAAGSVGASIDPADLGDAELMRLAMQLELTARDLYDESLAAGADPAIPGTMREQHESYAQALAGATGFSANTRNDTVFDQLSSQFATSDVVALAAVAYELESVAVATHTELLGIIQAPASARLIASIATMEARHCAVLADASGRGGDLDALLVNSADPLALEDLS